MKLIEVTVNITTRKLEYERHVFIESIESIIHNNILLTNDEFTRLLHISSLMLKKYRIDDPSFNDILDSFSKLVAYHGSTQQ